MYHFEYVPESQTKPVKKELLEIIHAVQDIMRILGIIYFR